MKQRPGRRFYIRRGLSPASARRIPGRRFPEIVSDADVVHNQTVRFVNFTLQGPSDADWSAQGPDAINVSSTGVSPLIPISSCSTGLPPVRSPRMASAS